MIMARPCAKCCCAATVSSPVKMVVKVVSPTAETVFKSAITCWKWRMKSSKIFSCSKLDSYYFFKNDIGIDHHTNENKVFKKAVSMFFNGLSITVLLELYVVQVRTYSVRLFSTSTYSGRSFSVSTPTSWN